MPTAVLSPSADDLAYDLTRDVNRVVLVGTLAEPPELHDLDEQTTVCFLRLRCIAHESPHLLGYEDPLEVNVLLLGAPAPKMAPYLYEGRRVVVDGSLASAQWETAVGAHPAECARGANRDLLGKASWSTSSRGQT
jgi:single-stranded DNA-binding protein